METISQVHQHHSNPSEAQQNQQYILIGQGIRARSRGFWFKVAKTNKSQPQNCEDRTGEDRTGMAQEKVPIESEDQTKWVLCQVRFCAVQERN